MTTRSQLPDYAPLTHRVIVAMDIERRRSAPDESQVHARDLAETLGQPVPKITGALRVLRECGSVRFLSGRRGAWALTEPDIRARVAAIREDVERWRPNAA